MNQSNLELRNKIKNLIQGINPLDSTEQEHIVEALQWIDSGREIFRLKKPDVPNKHLVSYFCLYDTTENKILLVDHKKAQLWLPTGGHVDKDEHPTEAARRECLEELELKADFLFDDPIFITSRVTVGLTAGHTDISLWYVLKGNTNQNLNFDEKEFESINWFSFDEIPYQKSDPNLKRFINKLEELI